MPVDDKAIHALRVDRRSNSSTLSDVHRAESFDRRSGISIPTFTAWPGLVGGRTFCRVRGADRPSAVPSSYRDVRMPALRRLRLRRSRMHPLRGADTSPNLFVDTDFTRSACPAAGSLIGLRGVEDRL